MTNELAIAVSLPYTLFVSAVVAVVDCSAGQDLSKQPYLATSFQDMRSNFASALGRPLLLILIAFLTLLTMTSSFFRGTAKKNLTRSLSAGFGRNVLGPTENRDPHPIQEIYDKLVSINDINAVAKRPRSSAQIRDIMEAMEDVTLSDLGLSKESLRAQRHSTCMNVVLAEDFHVSVFIIPKGKGLPLHDHPGMTVISKLVAGRLRVRSFSPLATTSSTSSEESNTVPFPSHPEASAKFEALLTTAATRTPSDPAWLLSPSTDNVHEFLVPEQHDSSSSSDRNRGSDGVGDADAACTVVLDVLLPPYDEVRRPCNYYSCSRKGDEGGEGEGSRWELTCIDEPRGLELPYTTRYTGITPNIKKGRKHLRSWS
jgi:PCO_ADO